MADEMTEGMDRHENRDEKTRACTKGELLFSRSLSHSLALITSYIVQTNKHYELNARKNLLRNKWTSRFIKFMSIFTLSIYLSLQPSISSSFILLKRKEMVYIKQFMQLTWAHTHTHSRRANERAQPIQRAKKTSRTFEKLFLYVPWIPALCSTLYIRI